MNGPGGLFGLVHAHLVCAVRNTSYYEYFPGGSRDEAGKAIGLLNPPVPGNGHIAPPPPPVGAPSGIGGGSGDSAQQRCGE